MAQARDDRKTAPWQIVSWIEEAHWESHSHWDYEHLYGRISWPCCLPFCCSLSQASISANFRQTIGVSGICAGWIHAQQGTLSYVCLTLGCGIVSLQNSIPDGPCSERCRGPANSAWGTSFLWLVSFSYFSWLCPFFLHPSPLSALHLSLLFLHRWPGH